MDEPPADPLVAFAYGTFHASFLVVALVLIAQRAGAMGALRSLDTVSGLALFAALWGASVFAMWRAVVDKAPEGSLPMRGLSWGAAVGVVFFLAALVVLSFRSGVEPFTIILAMFGSVFAAGIGAFVGLAFVAIDGLLAWAVERIGEE